MSRRRADVKQVAQVAAAVAEGANTSRDVADLLAVSQDQACALLSWLRRAGVVRPTGRTALWEPGKKGRLCRVYELGREAPRLFRTVTRLTGDGGARIVRV